MDKEFEKKHLEYERGLRKRGLRNGPEYNDNESAPLIWYDQLFDREITPAGSVDCGQELLVGATQNGLDVILVASHKNKGELVFPEGATITLTTKVAEEREGEYTEQGPSYCITAPMGGISVGPDLLVARFPLSNFKKGWMKIRLEFSGEITGGTLDAGLGYVAR